MIEFNVGIIFVLDLCLEKFESMVNFECVVFMIIEIVDIVGFVKGVLKGEGFGNQFLVNIWEIDVIIYVVCCFEDGNIVYVDGLVNLVCDKEVIDIEL